MAEIKDYTSKWRGEEIDALLGLVSSHVNDATIHLQPGEREKWNTGSSSGGGSSVVTNVYWSDILNRPSWISDTPPEIFDLFEKVVVKEAVDEVRDADGNIVTEAQPAEYAIKAKYDLFSVGGISAYGFSGTGSGGGTASVDVTAILKEGVHIATINGVNIYAPEGGGASSWAELKDKPSWLTDKKPAVSYFDNDAKYITATVLSGALSGYATKSEVNGVLDTVAQTYVKLNDFKTYKSEVSTAIGKSADGVKSWVTGQGYATEDYVKSQKYGKLLGINGKYLRLLDEGGNKLNEVIAPYAAYTEQLGATGSTADVNIYGEVKMQNGSLAVAGNINANYDISAGGNLSAAGSLSVTGESRFSGAVYLPGQLTFFGRDGIYIEADRTTQREGTAAFIGVHQNHKGVKTIATVNLDGRVRIWQPMGINQDPEDDISLRVGGVLKTDYLTAGIGMKQVEGYWFASPNGYFGNPSTKTYTSFGDGGIELSQKTPYIDFHCEYSSDTDFTTRLIASEVGVVQIQSADTTDPALRIGNAYLRYDKVNNALYVTGQDGAQVHLYATGGIAAYSGLGSGITQLANLSLTGQLTAASVKANTYKIGENNDLYEESNGQLYFSLYDKFFIGGYDTYFDSDGGLHVNNGNGIKLTGKAVLRIGADTDEHGITDLYADGSYVYITINGKRYRFTPSSTTTV